MRDVIVVIPGILGSALAVDEDEIWGVSGASIWKNLTSLGRNLNRLKLPDGIGHDAPNDGVVATRLVPGLHVLPLFWKIEGYSHLIASLDRRFALLRPTATQPGNFIEFAYDWRLSNVLNAKRLASHVLPELDRWQKYSRNAEAKLVLICHSMGGLIARWFLEVLGHRELTRQLITIGTPYQGAIKALTALANGFRLGPIGARLDELVRSLPSAYQLLPTYDCLDVGNGFLQRLSAVSLPNINQVNVQEGLAFHARLQDSITPSPSYSTHVIKGILQPTFQSALLRQNIIEPLYDFRNIDKGGDGIVARPASHPPEWENDTQSKFYAQHHACLQSTDTILTQVEGTISERDGTWLSGIEQLRLDIPELVTAGAEVPVRVTSKDTRLLLYATCFAEDGRQASRPISLTPGGDGNYFGKFSDLGPGAFRISIHSAVPQKIVEEVSDWTLIWDKKKLILDD